MPGAVRALTRVALGAVRDNAVIFAVLVPFVCTALFVDAVTGVPVAWQLRPEYWEDSLALALRCSLLAVALSTGWFAVVELLRRSKRRQADDTTVSTLGDAWREFPLRPTAQRTLRLLVCAFAFSLFFHVFVGFKGAIPVFHPFAWDERLMHLDRLLHLGHDPWRLVHGVIGEPTATRVLDSLYYVWFPANIFVLIWFGWLENAWERNRFFLAYLLTWILLGNVAALAFSSAGPCYYDLATGSLGPYEGLMQYLRGVNTVHQLTALRVQAVLLEAYSADHVHPVEGIAAMPSLHVAMPFLFALAARRSSRLASVFFMVFGIVIMLGSVHLGWHYAVDGYAAIAAVSGIWWSVGSALRRLSSAAENAH